MYGRDEIVLVLVTYAAFLVFEDVIKLIWGVDPYFPPALYLLGRVVIGGIRFAVYDLGSARLRSLSASCLVGARTHAIGKVTSRGDP